MIDENQELGSLEQTFKSLDNIRRQPKQFNQGKLIKVTQSTMRAAQLLADARKDCAEIQATADPIQLSKILAEIGKTDKGI